MQTIQQDAALALARSDNSRKDHVITRMLLLLS